MPVGIGIGIAAIAWLLEGGFVQKFKELIQNKFALLFIAVYLVYAVSATYSQNKAETAIDLQLKLSLLLFPLILSTAKELNKKNCITILKAFVIGCLASIGVCLANTTYHTITTGENHFLYDKLSVFVQVGYYAMYLTFAAILIVFDWTTRVRRFSLIHLLALVAMGTMLVLLSARAQLVAFALILPIFGFVFLKDKLGIPKTSLIALTAIIAFGAAITAHPASMARLKLAYTDLTRKDVDKHSPYLNGINTRFIMWEVGTEIINENPLIGIGAGDVEDELLYRAEVQDIPSILRKELNFHSQYFQIAVATGLIGLAIFLASLIAPLVVAFKKRMLIYIAFMALIIISAVTESIFERQAGVIFFAFFNSLLFLKQPEVSEHQ